MSTAKNKQKNQAVPFGLDGMPDVLPRLQGYWRQVWETGRAVSELHDFYLLEPSSAEKYETFENAFGADKDFLTGRLFPLRVGKTKAALRFSFRESVLRSFIDHKLAYFAYPLKAFHFGPVWRDVNVNEYFFKQFHQLGFDVVGDADPIYDGEVIIAFYDFFKSLKLNNVILRINSSGCHSCRAAFRQKLVNYYRGKIKELCKSCAKDFEINPFSLLACEKEECKTLRAEGPTILDYLCQNCNHHLKSVLELVEDNGIAYEPFADLVSTSELNNRTIFEFRVPEIPHPLAFGSRYDYVSEAVFKRVIPAVGGNVGIERTIEAMMRQNIEPKVKSKPKVFFLVIGDEAKKGALKLMNKLRLSGVAVVEMVSKKTLKAQIRTAERMGIKLALLLGQKEVFDGTVIVREMGSGIQETILVDKLVEEVKKRLNND